jgi:hypothetical protein
MEFTPEGATANKHCYKEIFRRQRNSIRCKHPEFWGRKNWLLLHDDTPAHHSTLVQEELVKQQVIVLPRPPYSPDLAQCDFFFFPHLKGKLRWRRFQSAKEIVTATREAVQDLPANIFQQYFQQLYKRWQICPAASSDYFEEGCGYVWVSCNMV